MNCKQYHNDMRHKCPVCGLAPKLPANPLVLWGYEFMLKQMAPCSCGGVPVLICGGDPKTTRVYCQNKCGTETAEHKNDAHSGHDKAILEWNLIQEKRGFDLRKLHPINQ